MPSAAESRQFEIAHLRTLAIARILPTMEVERDAYGVPVEPAERMQHFLLGLFDLLDEAGQAEFSPDLIDDLNVVRLRFIDEFEGKFPGYGKRACRLALNVRFPSHPGHSTYAHKRSLTTCSTAMGLY